MYIYIYTSLYIYVCILNESNDLYPTCKYMHRSFPDPLRPTPPHPMPLPPTTSATDLAWRGVGGGNPLWVYSQIGYRTIDRQSI